MNSGPTPRVVAEAWLIIVIFYSLGFGLLRESAWVGFFFFLSCVFGFLALYVPPDENPIDTLFGWIIFTVLLYCLWDAWETQGVADPKRKKDKQDS